MPRVTAYGRTYTVRPALSALPLRSAPALLLPHEPHCAGCSLGCLLTKQAPTPQHLINLPAQRLATAAYFLFPIFSHVPSPSGIFFLLSPVSTSSDYGELFKLDTSRTMQVRSFRGLVTVKPTRCAHLGAVLATRPSLLSQLVSFSTASRAVPSPSFLLVCCLPGGHIWVCLVIGPACASFLAAFCHLQRPGSVYESPLSASFRFLTVHWPGCLKLCECVNMLGSKMFLSTRSVALMSKASKLAWCCEVIGMSQWLGFVFRWGC